MPAPKKKKLRVWHIPQVPGEPFHVKVRSVREAKLVLDALANYDSFQFEHRLKPDYSSAQGLEVFDGKKWCERESVSSYIDHYMKGRP